MRSIGSQLITELGLRRQRGMYFDYAAYRQLEKIDSLKDLASFVRSQGYECPSSPRDVQAVADALEPYNGINKSPLAWAWILSDPTGFLGLLALPYLLASKLFRKP